MASLITVNGPNTGRRFSLSADNLIIGRQPDAAIYLEELAVSRQHARLVRDKDNFLVEDLGSSNGTWVNGVRIQGRVPLTERDELQIGPYVLNLLPERPEPYAETPQQIVRAQVEVAPSNHTLFAQNASHKLRVVLEITQHVGHTLEIDPLLGRLLEHLLKLFPQADRGMVLLCEREQLIVRAQRTRLHYASGGDYPYSRTLVRRALDDGVGLLSEDVAADRNLVPSQTLVSLNLRSFLCVPMIGWEGRRLGLIQLDCLRQGPGFHKDDLELLTAIGLQVAVVLQNAAFHAERLREERLRQELMLAREIQQAFLPTDFDVLKEGRAELYARVNAAREVSGDLYDFFRLPDGRLAFFLGDVSGKGMPAALFMIAVRSLTRHLAPATGGPAELLSRLNDALKIDNPTHLFVTLIGGYYDDTDGSVVLASGAHPPPLLRRADGRVDQLEVQHGVMIGNAFLELHVTDTRVVLQPGETLVLYTDGFTEAFTPDNQMFGVGRLREVLGGPRTSLSLQECAEQTGAAVQRFTGQAELQDDQTLLLLRRL